MMALSDAMMGRGSRSKGPAVDLKALREDLGSKAMVCEVHGEYQSKGDRYLSSKTSREIWSGCPACKQAEAERERRAEQAAAATREQARLQELLLQSCLPRRFLDRTLETYRTDTDKQARVLAICKAYAANFGDHMRTGESLILAGNKGTGKTHLAAGIISAILPAHVGAYTTMLDLLRTVRSTWGQGAARKESQVLAELAAVDLLVIDEIGLQYDTDAERVLFSDVVDLRYRSCKPMILISNQEPSEFEQTVGERAHDRLREMARWLPFDWESVRSAVRKGFAA